MSIFNSNDYDRGYENGYKDAVNKDSKRYGAMGLSFKFVIHGRKALDSYTKGYNQGYAKGMWARMQKKQAPQNAKIKSSKKIVSIMQRGIDGQIELLNQMKEFLEGLSTQFDEINKRKQQFLSNLDGEGLDLKLLQRFEEYFEENRNRANSLINKIESEDIPYTEQVIRHLEDTPR